MTKEQAIQVLAAKQPVKANWSEAARQAAESPEARAKAAQTRKAHEGMSDSDLHDAIHETHDYLHEELGKKPSHRDIADELEANHGIKIHPSVIKKHLSMKASEIANQFASQFTDRRSFGAEEAAVRASVVADSYEARRERAEAWLKGLPEPVRAVKKG